MVPYNVVYLGDGRWHRRRLGRSVRRGHAGNARAVAERIGDRPAALQLSDDMLGVAWGKLLINLNNAINALSGRTLLEELQRARLSAGLRRLDASRGCGLLDAPGSSRPRSARSARTAARACIGSPDWLFHNSSLKKWKIDAKARSSMADDFAAGRKTEVDYLNGEVVAARRTAGPHGAGQPQRSSSWSAGRGGRARTWSAGRRSAPRGARPLSGSAARALASGA